LRRQYFNGPCRRIQNGERHGHLLLFFYRLSYRNLKLLSFPVWILNPFCLSKSCSGLPGFSGAVLVGLFSVATFFVSPTTNAG